MEPRRLSDGSQALRSDEREEGPTMALQLQEEIVETKVALAGGPHTHTLIATAEGTGAQGKGCTIIDSLASGGGSESPHCSHVFPHRSRIAPRHIQHRLLAQDLPHTQVGTNITRTPLTHAHSTSALSNWSTGTVNNQNTHRTPHTHTHINTQRTAPCGMCPAVWRRMTATGRPGRQRLLQPAAPSATAHNPPHSPHGRPPPPHPAHTHHRPAASTQPSHSAAGRWH